MGTALASQLQALASRQAVAAEKRPLTRPSLLFEPRQAADIDLLTIYNLALSGLEELSNMSSVFESYKKALFSPESNHSDRELQGREFNSKLNNSISSYLRLLSGFLLLTPAHQTLEYLIRRYQVHIYNVDDIVKSFLPYHETTLFVRMVQILDIEKTKWRFLEGVKTNGASLPRAVLVQQCLRDLSVLESICDTASAVSENMTSSRIAISFSVAVVMECLGAAGKTTASIFDKILPFVLHSFGKGVPEEFRVGGLMIISCVASKENLSGKVINMLFDSIAKNSYKDLERVGGEKLFKMSMMVLIHIMQMQSLEHFPDKAFKFLVKARDLPDILAEISVSFNANKFTSLFLKSLVKHSVLNKHYEDTLVACIGKLRLEHHIESVIAAFIDLCNNKGTISGESTDNHMDADSETRNTVKRLLSAIDDHYPDQLSKGINRFLETSSGTSKFTVDLLVELLHGSLSCPMPESNKTVYLSLEHPEAHVREAAIKKVSNILSVASTENNSKVKLLLGEALLQCFYDENFGVVQCVYSVDGLVKLINADQLFEAQVSILSRCFEAFDKGNRSCREAAESVGKLCLHFLSSQFLQDNPLFLQRVGCVFLNALLLFSKTAKLNRAALGLAQSLPFPLFSKLGELNDDSRVLTNGDVKYLQASKKSKRGNTNRKIVSLLAQSLMECPETSIPSWADDLTNLDRAKVLILLILLHCVQIADSGCKWIYIEKTLNFLKQEWSALETKKILNNSLLKVSYSEADTEDMLSSEILVTLESEVLPGYSKLLAMSFYRILMLVPSFQMDENEDQRQECFKVLKELFILFSMSSVRRSLREHFKLILNCVSSYVVDFLSTFFLEEASAFSQDVQKNSIEQMKALFESLSTARAYHIQSSHLQISVPRLLVALCSPLKVVRKAACECLQNIQALWSNHAQSLIKNGARVLDVPFLPQSTFMAFVGALTEFHPTFLSDEKFLSIFLTSALGNNESMQESSLQVNERFTTESVRSIVLYLIQHAVKLPTYAKCVLILSLEGLGQVVFEVAEVNALLLELLERRRKFHLKSTTTADGKLTSVEIKLTNSIIRNILQHGDINTRNMERNKANKKFQIFFEATNVDGGNWDDLAVIEPCQLALKSLHTEDYDKWDFSMQDQVLQRILSLSSTDCESLRSAASSALRNIHINVATMAKQIKKLCSLNFDIKSSSSESTNVFKSTTELLEFLLWKVDIGNRLTLVEPLFELLEKIFPLESLSNNVLQEYSGDAPPVITAETSDISPMRYIQELVVTILDGIAISASNESREIVESMEKIYKVDFIVRIISVVSDTPTRNQALKLLTTLAKSIPFRVLNHVMKVFEIVGKMTVIQDDTHSHLVTEQLIAAVVPSWLAQTKNSRELVEIFVRAMPKIPVLRRMPLVKNTLRIMGETANLHVFVLLLLEASLKVLESTRPILKKKNRTEKKKTHASSEDTDDWATEFSAQLCEQFWPSLRLHAFIHLLEATRSDANGISISEIDDHWPLQHKTIKFISVQLQRSDLLSELESDQNGACQGAIVSLLEQVLLHLRWLSDSICSPKTKKLLQDSACSLLDSLTEILSLSSFAKGIAHILKRSDTRVKLRVLKLVSEKMKEKDSSKLSGWAKALNVPECKDACVEMVVEVGNVLKCTPDAMPSSSMNIKLAAVSALDVCAIRFGAKQPDVFVNNFRTVLMNLHNSKLTVACLSCMATLVSQLGVHLLPVLSEVVSETLKFANGKLSEVKEETIPDKEDNPQTSDTGFQIALLTFLGSIVENQGGFLNPYLKNILSLLIMQRQFNSNSNTDDSKHRKVRELQSLIAEKIPARLLLDPLLKLYEKAVKEGEASTAACFHILSVVAIKLDRDSVVQYHKRMFDFCLTALDLRRKRPESFKSVMEVETYVISVITNLVMKLSESTFKPFFVKVHEWAESEVPDDKNGTIQSLDRSIAFFKLVNQLAEKLRSILVPYFQYLLNGCVRHLTNGEEEPVKKRKKSEKSSSETRKSLSSTEWHLRFVVISALHKCFVYDTVGFLDASKFQMLLGPIVQQIVVVPPAEASNADDVPKVSEMDDALVSCLGQMALAAKSDLLWKPLNHEVLLCTRNESVRARTLGLDVVKYLVEHLKEDYLVLLPETIPFLAELLEDPELTVVSKSQDIIKMLEELSGESLQQYL